MKTLTHQAGRRRRTTFAVVAAASCLTLVSACGSDPQPASGSDGSSSSGGSKTLVFSPIGLQVPAMKGLVRGRAGLQQEQGLDGHRAGPEPRPAEAGPADLQRSSSPAGRRAWVIAIAPALASGREDGAEKKVCAADQRRPRGLRPLRPAAGHHLRQDRLRRQGTGPGRAARQVHQREARRQRRGASSTSPLRAPRARRSSRRPPWTPSAKPRRRQDRADLDRQRPARRRRPTSATCCRATPTSTPSLGNNDEGALGALGAFKAAGKKLPCLTEFGGNDEVLAPGQGGHDLRLRGSAVRRRHGAVVRHAGQAMEDPDRGRPAPDGPAEGHQGRELSDDALTQHGNLKT